VPTAYNNVYAYNSQQNTYNYATTVELHTKGLIPHINPDPKFITNSGRDHTLKK
jgi:hypothetical protein